MARDIGAWRKDDPETSEEAARSIDTSTIKIGILQALREQAPLNGWEMSLKLELPTISVCRSDRTDGWITLLGTRPGPSGRAQNAYVISDLGEKVLGGGSAPKVLADGQMELL